MDIHFFSSVSSFHIGVSHIDVNIIFLSSYDFPLQYNYYRLSQNQVHLVKKFYFPGYVCRKTVLYVINEMQMVG